MAKFILSLQEWCKQNNRLDLLEEWNYDLNGSPSNYGYRSSKRVSWICSRCGYMWKTRLEARTRTVKATGCRKCSKRNNSSFPEQAVYHYICKYFPDAINGDHNTLNGRELDIFIPSINTAIEYDGQKWHSDINKDIEKDELCKQLGITLYRIRETADNFEAFHNSILMIYEFQNWSMLNGIIITILNNCGIQLPNSEVDIERDAIKIKEQFFSELGKKSLAMLYPDIASEWDATKNGTLKPSMISPQDHDEYWWICPICHKSYKAIVKNRTSKLCGCNDCGAIEGGRKQMSQIRNVDTGEIFSCLADAATSVGVSKAAIVKVCQGQNQTCKGFKWEYVNRDKDHRPRRLKQPTQRPIQNIDTGKIYDSLADAVQDTGITNISAVCRGLRQTAGGYHWKYVERDD